MKGQVRPPPLLAINLGAEAKGSGSGSESERERGRKGGRKEGREGEEG